MLRDLFDHFRLIRQPGWGKVKTGDGYAAVPNPVVEDRETQHAILPYVR